MSNYSLRARGFLDLLEIEKNESPRGGFKAAKHLDGEVGIVETIICKNNLP
jgi:hypothetical protein